MKYVKPVHEVIIQPTQIVKDVKPVEEVTAVRPVKESVQPANQIKMSSHEEELRTLLVEIKKIVQQPEVIHRNVQPAVPVIPDTKTDKKRKPKHSVS